MEKCNKEVCFAFEATYFSCFLSINYNRKASKGLRFCSCFVVDIKEPFDLFGSIDICLEAT